MLAFRIERFDAVASTNELVKRALDEGCAEGLVCRADEQAGGYGRQGRVWVSPRGGLYQSILLRPDVPAEHLPTLGLAVALSVRDALLAAGGLDAEAVQVKWPNDVVCSQGKLAGISLEAHAGGVCVGIGANVLRPAGAMAVEGKNTPAYLADLVAEGACSPAADVVGDEVLNALANRYDAWLSMGFAPFADEFNACHVLAGKHVSIADRNGSVVASGLVAGVSADGSLLVGGTPVSSGEAHIL